MSPRSKKEYIEAIFLRYKKVPSKKRDDRFSLGHIRIPECLGGVFEGSLQAGVRGERV